MNKLLSALQAFLILILAIFPTIISPMMPELFPEMQVIIANKQIKDAINHIGPILKLTHTIQGHTGPVTSVAFNHDGTTIATASFDKKVKEWNVQTGKLTRMLQDPATPENTTHTNYVTSVAFSPDGTKIATASWDKTVKKWNEQTGQKICTLIAPIGDFNFATFSPDDTTIATASTLNVVDLWNTQSCGLIRTLRDPATPENTTHTDFVTSVAFSPDGTTIATASWDKTVKKWNAQTGQLIHTLRDPTTPENTTHADKVTSVTFSHDGTTMATASFDKKVKKWNAQTSQLIHTLRDPATPENTTHTGYVTSVAFSHDGTTMATGSWDKTAKIWDLQPQRKQQVFDWFKYNLRPDQAIIINRAYEAKHRGKKLALKGDGLVTFNTMTEDVQSLLIDYLDIIVP